MHSFGANAFFTLLIVVIVYNVGSAEMDEQVCHKTPCALGGKESAMDRDKVTEKIISKKVKHNMKWADIATKIGRSKEWTTAALLGQMTLNAEQAVVAKELFDLTDEEAAWLQIVPHKGSFGNNAVPSDPLIYRWYEMINVYGTTIKELIHEEFGDGIMSAIDMHFKIEREKHAKGDRVNVVISGKFLPYTDF